MEQAVDRVESRAVGEQDELLWARSVAGDGEAFGLLFDRHRERVWRHACRFAPTRQDAEDLVAAVFLELWRLRHRVLLVGGSVLPWLLTVTTNLGLNAARARRRYRSLLDRLPRADDEKDAAVVALEARGLGFDGHLRDELRALTLKDAQLLALVALEGYSVLDAAECLQLSEPAARARLHRVRTRLQKRLRGTDVAPRGPFSQEEVR